MECIIRPDSSGDYVLLDRATGVEYARGTDAQVRLAAQGVHTITAAPRLRPVEIDPSSSATSPYPQYVQCADETVVFNGRQIAPGDMWTDGVLYPDLLDVGWAERLADVPQFIHGIELLTGQSITTVRGTASVALPGDALLLGDWIRTGYFQPSRLERRFGHELGGTWKIRWSLKSPRQPRNGYVVTIDRTPGT